MTAETNPATAPRKILMTTSAPTLTYFDKFMRGKFALQVCEGDEVIERLELDGDDAHILRKSKVIVVTETEAGDLVHPRRQLCTLDSGSTYERESFPQTDPAQDTGWNAEPGKLGNIEAAQVIGAKLYPKGHDHAADRQRQIITARLAKLVGQEFDEDFSQAQVDALEAALIELGLLAT